VDPTKLDVYAAGLVLWFLLYRRHPLGEYAAQGRHELAAKVKKQQKIHKQVFGFPVSVSDRFV
jgi:hypothetical protein